MPISVRNAGTWSQAKDIYVRNAGSWAKTKDVWIRNAGAWSKAHIASVELTIAVNTSDYNIKTAATAAGWNGVDAVRVLVTVNSGIIVSGSTTAGYAMRTDTGWPAGSLVEIYNNGFIIGDGGDGGNGGNYPSSGGAGGAGGTALYAQVATTLYNYGTVAGGGGGSNGSSSYLTGPICSDMCSFNDFRQWGGDGGGGGQSGLTNSNGGSAGTGSYRNGTAGADGTFSAPGADGGGFGNTGGAWGSAPADGGGGAGGNYILGNSFLTVAATGTLLGGVA